MSKKLSKVAFDEIIKKQIVESGETDNVWNQNYGLYYCKEAFEEFKEEMRKKYPDAYRDYGAGKGGEFNCRKANGHKYPPKMASVASSSRFCYLTLRDGAKCLDLSGKPKFEVGRKIDGIDGNPPQLDAFFKGDNTYFEVKCHEIFDYHSIKMNAQYEAKLSLFGLSPDSYEKDNENIKIPFSEFDISGRKTSRFDIKQLLCHLLGIASVNKKPATLIYMFFKPICSNKEDQNAVDEVFDELKSEIEAIFGSKPIKKFCKDYEISLKAIAVCSDRMKAISECEIIPMDLVPNKDKWLGGVGVPVDPKKVKWAAKY